MHFRNTYTIMFFCRDVKTFLQVQLPNTRCKNKTPLISRTDQLVNIFLVKSDLFIIRDTSNQTKGYLSLLEQKKFICYLVLLALRQKMGKSSLYWKAHLISAPEKPWRQSVCLLLIILQSLCFQFAGHYIQYAATIIALHLLASGAQAAALSINNHDNLPL